MCGIMGYIGKDDGYPVVIEGLQKLEYRGYDSSGVAIMNGSLNLYKKQGKVEQLKNFIHCQKTNGNIVLGHTRWATHGVPSDYNAHPHTSQSGRLVMVHNGIIENYETLKQILIRHDFTFKSDTDSEVLVQYIEWYMLTYTIPLKEAVRRALSDVEGTYAILILDTNKPNSICIAKKDNPLAFGLKNGAFYIASDAGPISTHTQEIIYLQDREIAELFDNGQFQLFDLDNNRISANITHVKSFEEDYCKGNFDSYMLKEIFDQPSSIYSCMEDRIDPVRNEIIIPEIENHKRIFTKTKRIIILGCGTSWHAALIGKYLFESLSSIKTEVDYASEFRYRNPIIDENDIVIAISQSGETADTLAALKLANEKGAFTYSIVNTEGSSIARNSDIVSYLNIGIEIGVASTKAFTAQVTLLSMIALRIGRLKGTIKLSEYIETVKEIQLVPQKIQTCLTWNDSIKKIAQLYSKKDHALFLGRGINFPAALEGALKLKEISYIHAEGYPAAEMKHGPIALIDKEMPVFVLANNQSSLQKLISNIQEIKSREGLVIVIKEKGTHFPKEITDHCIEVPKTQEIFTPILASIPFQLFAYHSAKMRKCNVDQPRNLAKSVTVE